MKIESLRFQVGLIALFALGVGWSFLRTGATALLHVKGGYTIDAMTAPFLLAARAATPWAARSAGWRVGRVAA